MKNNYHTHIYRCGHAYGTEKDMIEAAIELGLEGIGISDHIPYPVLSTSQGYSALQSKMSEMIALSPGMRMNYITIYEHLKEVKECKKLYPSIHIYQGFEAEYFPFYRDYLKNLLDTNTVDYLILGHHYFIDERVKGYYGKDNISDSEIRRYGKEVIKGLETGLFSYLAHPDLFLQGCKTFNQACKETTYLICQKAKELDIPLEINAGRLHHQKIKMNGEMTYIYPNNHFWKIASEVGNKAILGFDAHHPSSINRNVVEILENFAKQYDLELIEELEFKKG